MTGHPGIHALSDARWRELAPLVDEDWGHCKVPHENLRQTIEAIVWRHQNGAKWRSSPAELLPALILTASPVRGFRPFRDEHGRLEIPGRCGISTRPSSQRRTPSPDRAWLAVVAAAIPHMLRLACPMLSPFT